MQAKKKRFSVVISRDECKGCGRCVSACPRQVLAMANALNLYGFPYATPVAGQECVGCGACFYACPEPGAITVMETVAGGKKKAREADGT